MMRIKRRRTPHRAPRLAHIAAAWPLLGLLIAAVALAYGVPFRALAEPTPQSATATSATPSPSATFPPTPTPTESPPDLKLAALLTRGGQIDKASGALLAVVARGRPAERLTARLALAKLYLSEGSSSQAIRQLDAYLLEAPANTDVRDAQFMLARALSASGGDLAALPLYAAYLQAGGPAQTYARIGQAESLASAGQTAQAASAASAVLAQDLPPSIRSAFELQMAQAFESTSPQDAISWYSHLRNDSSAPSDQALALWRTAVLRSDLGQGPPLIETWLTIIQRYPETPIAAEIVDHQPPYPPNANYAALDSYYTGLVYYRAGRGEEARRAFAASVQRNQNGPDPTLGVPLGARSIAARSAYYVAVLDETVDAEVAIAGYGRVLELDPTVDLADDALWWQGRLLEQAGRNDEASAAYQQIVANYGGSKFADDARFRVGLLAYDARNYVQAANAFAAIAKASHDDVRQRALLWQGKALSAAHKSDSARTALETLRQEAPDGYYGLRAAVLLGDASGKLRAGTLESAPEPDWTAIESWLNGQSAGQPLLAQQALFANPHWGAGRTLLSLGMTRQAGAEFGVLLDQASRNPALLLELSHYFQGAGMIDLSSKAAARLLGQLPDSQVVRAPPDLWRLAYPAPFAAATDAAALAEDVPAVLLFGLVRQESFFDPLAGSTAGALGLTQVVPATGAAIAQDFKVAPFDPAQLFEADTSLLFGAHYLHQQLDTFNGDIYAALAAYNAGPGSALRWQKAAGGDVDRFVAEIDYSQTESYVQIVIENLARYRQLYQGLADPALPKD